MLKDMKDLIELYIILHIQSVSKDLKQRGKKFQRKKIKYSNCDFLYFLSSIVLDEMVNKYASFN